MAAPAPLHQRLKTITMADAEQAMGIVRWIVEEGEPLIERDHPDFPDVVCGFCYSPAPSGEDFEHARKCAWVRSKNLVERTLPLVRSQLDQEIVKAAMRWGEEGASTYAIQLAVQAKMTFLATE